MLTNLASVNKTLRFRLIPMFETEQNIQKFKVLEREENRFKAYKELKPYLTAYLPPYSKMPSLRLQPIICWTSKHLQKLTPSIYPEQMTKNPTIKQMPISHASNLATVF